MENELKNAMEPKSDQLNADDFASGEERTITITKVVNRGGNDQPVSVFFEGDNKKPYKPCKSMVRVMFNAWGGSLANYVGKKAVLYVDPTVMYGPLAVGGIRIKAVSGIQSDLTVMLTKTRGKKYPYIVKPILESAPKSSAPATDEEYEKYIMDVMEKIGNCDDEKLDQMENWIVRSRKVLDKDKKGLLDLVTAKRKENGN